MAKEGILRKVTRKFARDNERGARKNMLEDLFYDLHKSRVEIYKMNFFRGIFFGLGSVLGGTVVIALVIWVLSLFVAIPWIGDTAEQVQDTLKR